MFRLIAAGIALALTMCACATTPADSPSSETSISGVESVTVGGEIQVRGQYLHAD
jgi:hypothetical protein